MLLYTARHEHRHVIVQGQLTQAGTTFSSTTSMDLLRCVVDLSAALPTCGPAMHAFVYCQSLDATVLTAEWFLVAVSAQKGITPGAINR